MHIHYQNNYMTQKGDIFSGKGTWLQDHFLFLESNFHNLCIQYVV